MPFAITLEVYEMPNKNPSGMSHSGIECLRRCPKRFWFSYRAGGNGILATRRPIYFDIGSAYHEAMEFIGRVWNEHQEDDLVQILSNGIADVVKGYTEVCGDRVDADSKDLIYTHATGLAYAHAEYFLARCQDWKFVAVEKDFETKMLDETLRGRVDAIATLEGRTWLVEHKALSHVSDNFIDVVPRDAQVLRYANALRKGGIPISGVIYTVGLKCALRLKKSESNPEFLARIAKHYKEEEATTIKHFQVLLDKSDLERCEAETAETLAEIRTRDVSNKWTQYTGGCENKYDVCEFMRVCLQQPWDGNSEVPPGFSAKHK